MAKKRTPKAKQGFLPTMEPPSIPEIDGAADAYFDAKNDRVAATEIETVTRDNLIEKMVANKLTRYVTPDELVVDLLSKSSVKCKKKAAVEEDGD